MQDWAGEAVAGPAIRLGISACLLGQQVRFDGGHKRDPFLVRTLGRYVQWVPVCPEVGIGLGVPRERLRLVGDALAPGLLATKAGCDYAPAMEAWAEERSEELATFGLHGFIFKKDSPSCGLYRVRAYNQGDVPVRNGRGIFARELVMRLPCLPVEEEGRLHDMRLRENLIERIFTYYRWTRTLATAPTPQGLAAFHRQHKLTILAHSPRHYLEMGRLVARARYLPWEPVQEEYGCLLTGALQVLGKPARHASVLQYILGHLKDTLSQDDQAELAALIEDYRRELVPLIVPLTLIRHFLRQQHVPAWLGQQTYLNPYPKELALRNHV